jgi:hypothetical protein
MDEGGAMFDLDQSLHYFPLRSEEATDVTIAMSAIDHNAQDAQETSTTRESFDEAIDCFAVSPSLEFFRQRTRGLGFVAPDERASPALADSITEMETVVVPESKAVAVPLPPRAGLLGLCNPFLLGHHIGYISTSSRSDVQ